MSEAAEKDQTASEQIDSRIASLGDWRGAALARARGVIREADPDIVEEVKWRKPSNPAGVPVWECSGIICTGETYKDKVKLTFARGGFAQRSGGTVQLQPRRRHAARDRHSRRRRDRRNALKALVREAVTLNASKAPR
jgi:hypothetical protein